MTTDSGNSYFARTPRQLSVNRPSIERLVGNEVATLRKCNIAPPPEVTGRYGEAMKVPDWLRALLFKPEWAPERDPDELCEFHGWPIQNCTDDELIECGHLRPDVVWPTRRARSRSQQ